MQAYLHTVAFKLRGLASYFMHSFAFVNSCVNFSVPEQVQTEQSTWAESSHRQRHWSLCVRNRVTFSSPCLHQVRICLEWDYLPLKYSLAVHCIWGLMTFPSQHPISYSQPRPTWGREKPLRSAWVSCAVQRGRLCNSHLLRAEALPAMESCQTSWLSASSKHCNRYVILSS